MGEQTTTTTQVVIPQVMADMISAKLSKKLRFSTLAQIDNTLVGKPGDTITYPKWAYIGAAEDVAEGAPIPIAQLGSSTANVTVKKAGKGVEVTTEAVIKGLGDPLGEAANQIALSIADKIDNDALAALGTATQKVTPAGASITLAELQQGVDMFTDEDLQSMLLITNPVDAVALRDEYLTKNAGADVAANTAITGAFAEVLGVNIMRSNKLDKGKGFLVKMTVDTDTEDVTPALKLVMKEDVTIKTDEDIETDTTMIVGTEHYGVYLYDPTKVVKFDA